jgi:hypothetical protein
MPNAPITRTLGLPTATTLIVPDHRRSSSMCSCSEHTLPDRTLSLIWAVARASPRSSGRSGPGRCSALSHSTPCGAPRKPRTPHLMCASRAGSPSTRDCPMAPPMLSPERYACPVQPPRTCLTFPIYALQKGETRENVCHFLIAPLLVVDTPCTPRYTRRPRAHQRSRPSHLPIVLLLD